MAFKRVVRQRCPIDKEGVLTADRHTRDSLMFGTSYIFSTSPLDLEVEE